MITANRLNKTMIALTFAMIIVLIIPLASASNNATENPQISINDDSSDFILNQNNGELIGTSPVYVDSNYGDNNGSGSQDKPVKTISQGLNIVQSGGTIYLTGIFSGEGNLNITFNSEPNNIEFIGIGNATIDGNHSNSFAIVNTGTYSFKNITFINNHKTGTEDKQFGGVFNNEIGKLTFENCIFRNNDVFGVNRANGGAIDNNEGTVIVRNCTFNNNTAYVTNSSGFRKNAADGGAISNLGYLSIYDSSFINNTALRNGGAIRTQDGAKTNIRNSKFIGNVAAYHRSGGSFGGAIYSWDCELNVVNSVFKNNRVYDSSGYGAQGGAISSDRGSGKISITSCQFINNTAKGVGTVSGQSIYIGSVTASVNYCTIDTGVYSISQSSDFNNNWWDVNDSNIDKLIENIPSSAKVTTFAELKVTSDIWELEINETKPLFVNLCWNGTDNQDNIKLIPTRSIYLESNCGNIANDTGYLTDGSFNTTIKINSTENPLVSAKVDDVIVNFNFTNDKNEFAIKCEEISSGTVLITIYSTENNTGICLIDIGDGKYYTELVNGKSTTTVYNLKTGTYDVIAKYLNNITQTAETTITVNNSDPIDTKIVVASSFTRPATDSSAGEKGGTINIKLTDNKGNLLANQTLQVALNCKIYNITTDNKGSAQLKISLQTAKVYTCAVSFKGNEKYNAAPLAITKLTITKKKTSIVGSAKTFKAKAKTKTVSVTLKTVKNKYNTKAYLKKGKKLTLKIKGHTYTAKTNAKGIAKFTIKLTKKGKYSAKVKFAGDSTYKASTKSIRITIK